MTQSSKVSLGTSRLLWIAMLLSSCLMAVEAGGAQEDDLAADGLALGWVATFEQDDRSFQRIDIRAALSEQASPVDVRLRDDAFRMLWEGLIESEARGEYQFAVMASGDISFTINDQSLLAAKTTEPQWIESEPIELSFDLHEIHIEYRPSTGAAELQVYWRGPRFAWESFPMHRMMHDLDQSIDTSWERGRDIVASRRCQNCHQIETGAPSLKVTSLDNSVRSIKPKWLVEHLAANHESLADNSSRTMPSYNLSDEDARDLASYLISRTEEDSRPRPAVPAPNEALAKAGEELFVTLGCLACHQVNDLGSSGPFHGGDLTNVAAKRSPDFFEKWLRNPASINPNHRMPVFKLNEEERTKLSIFLQTCGPQGDPEWTQELGAKEAIENGAHLFEQLSCASCHDERRESQVLIPITGGLADDLQASCLASPDSANGRPGYGLTDAQIADVRAFLGFPSQREQIDVSFVVKQMNCVGCHKRDESLGLDLLIPETIEQHSNLAPFASAMKPPSLNGVGDKLYAESLMNSIKAKNNRRPWLRVRMPEFQLSDDELKQISAWFISIDRTPSQLSAELSELNQDLVAVSGPRLITSTGFGCSSCHQVGSIEAPNAPLNAKGPNLSMMGDHLRYEWFRRWVANPSRFEPGMEMPSIQQPVKGILNDELEAQLAATWQILNTPGFEPPRPEPVRIVRHVGSNTGDRAAILTDVLRTEERSYVQPFIIGLNNRHNLLFDFERARLEQWWLGDTLRQHTEGKTWFWERGGPLLWSTANAEQDSEWSLHTDGESLEPRFDGQFRSEVTSWSHDGSRLSFTYQLSFRSADSETTRTVSFKEEIAGSQIDSTNQSGWTRSVQVNGLEPGEELWLSGFAPLGGVRESDDMPSHISVDRPHPVDLHVVSPKQIGFSPDGTLRFSATEDNSLDIELLYVTSLPVDRVQPAVAIEEEALKPETINVAPGFVATRLPIMVDWMPTAMSWNRKGEMFVTSLKGRVWKLIDSDGDGIEDRAVVFADELAAPFGIFADESSVDVIHKGALLRLRDSDGDGFAESSKVLASGWGHTTDYHDWAIGLPRDRNGNYYIALACQQDNRSTEAAKFRGETLKLIPESEDRYRIERLSSGHRFPIGIAQNAAGDVFVTDNQGNYNPFNELNHVRRDGWFGFVNRLDKAPNKPHLSPSINIPHPWTRSVNGICFLADPTHIDSNLATKFGPFAGHLVGCEYDTQRIVRMSLQKVGDTYQGAVYPLTYDTPRDGQTLLGPLACAVSPAGELYIGNIRDSGWGGSNNIGSMVRLSFDRDTLPCGIAEVTAIPDGFEIDFTKPIAGEIAAREDAYRIVSYRRISTPAYGGDDVDRREEHPSAIEVSEDGMSVTLRFAELRSGFVYQFDVENLSNDNEFFPAKAFYSLNVIPNEQQ